eukprot:CAMPEP_0201966274 /NCGR_PEP_ID=MMETSP0904-20121228/11324_1 /ASSEMBLY_ACC=CAM_ASM_000553 /TAXON_ID=420261 /ORGANISM="Thalassiosira antarctica, Strain CCMP982" /LENGTH=52 /DNA_ID=CAMNT_0048513501 /DNA_START=408 /DNA_END=567 /DNA_ORIENTATION=-
MTTDLAKSALFKGVMDNDPGRMGVMYNGHGLYPPSAVAQGFFSYLGARHLKV